MTVFVFSHKASNVLCRKNALFVDTNPARLAWSPDLGGTRTRDPIAKR